MEYLVTIFIVVFPLILIFSYEIKKRNINFNELKKSLISEFYKYNVFKFQILKKLFDKWYEKNKKVESTYATEYVADTCNNIMFDSETENIPLEMLEIMKNDFLKNPYIDKFSVQYKNITYKFENNDHIIFFNNYNNIQKLIYVYNNFKTEYLLSEDLSIKVLTLFESLSSQAIKRPIHYNDSGATFKQYLDITYKEEKIEKNEKIEKLLTLYDIKKKQLELLSKNNLEYSFRKKELKLIQKQINQLKKN